MNRCSQVKSETLSVSWIISTGSSDQNAFKSTTQHMTCVVSKIHFIQGMAMQPSWCSHEKKALMPTLSGMHKYLVPFSLQLTIMVWIEWWNSCGWDGMESCLATIGVLKKLTFQKLDSSQTPLVHSGFLTHHSCSMLATSFQLFLMVVWTLFFLVALP